MEQPDDTNPRPTSGGSDSPTSADHRKGRSIEAAAVAGIAYALLSTLAMARLSRFPSLDLDDEELTAWFDDDEHQAWLLLALNLASLSAVSFLWFVAVMRRRLGDREDRFFGTVFLGSALSYVAVWLVGAAAVASPAIALTLLDAGSVTPGSASLSAGLGASLILVVAPRLQAVFVFSTSTIILRSHFLPGWLAYLGYLTGLILFFVPLITRPLGLAMPIWVFVVSVVILVSRRDEVIAGLRSTKTAGGSSS